MPIFHTKQTYNSTILIGLKSINVSNLIQVHKECKCSLYLEEMSGYMLDSIGFS
jgi:hypothetical protein